MLLNRFARLNAPRAAIPTLQSREPWRGALLPASPKHATFDGNQNQAAPEVTGREVASMGRVRFRDLAAHATVTLSSEQGRDAPGLPPLDVQSR
jgi:hypothetical protein